ncbi:MAG: DoxX family protein [Arcanobacterium sp.]|nr:DoxX family protein [Arcanobacterium sp.]
MSSVLVPLSRFGLALPFITSGIEAMLAPEGHRERIHNIAPALELLPIDITDAVLLDRSTILLGALTTVAGCGVAVNRCRGLSTLCLLGTQIPITLANNPFWQQSRLARRKSLLGIASAIGLAGGLALNHFTSNTPK